MSPPASDQATPRAPGIVVEEDDSLQKKQPVPPDQELERPQYESEEPPVEMDPRLLMEREKGLYPGASTWAEDEERLFEILYLRQDLPMLPSHWEFDFRGRPIPETIFSTSDEYLPIVYAYSNEFRGEQTT